MLHFHFSNWKVSSIPLTGRPTPLRKKCTRISGTTVAKYRGKWYYCFTHHSSMQLT